MNLIGNAIQLHRQSLESVQMIKQSCRVHSHSLKTVPAITNKPVLSRQQENFHNVPVLYCHCIFCIFTQDKSKCEINFFFNLYRCSVYALNRILYEPIWKWCCFVVALTSMYEDVKNEKLFAVEIPVVQIYSESRETPKKNSLSHSLSLSVNEPLVNSDTTRCQV